MEQTDIINGCIKVESLVASIYSNLLQVFPKDKEFWESMLNDERDHIAFLIDVKSQGLITEIEKMDLPPSINVIQKNLKLVNKVSQRIADEPISMKNALKLALKLEESLVETYTNELIAKLLSCEDETSYEELINGEKTHVDKIRNMLQKTK